MSSVTFDLDPCGGGRHERCHRSPSSGKTPTYRRSTTRLWSPCSTTTDRCRGSAKPTRAKNNGKVERPFRCNRKDFFLNRTFRNLDDFNAQFDKWPGEIANPCVHATTDLTDATPDAMGSLAGYNGGHPQTPFNLSATSGRFDSIESIYVRWQSRIDTCQQGIPQLNLTDFLYAFDIHALLIRTLADCSLKFHVLIKLT